jgi:hypothetical protein
MNSFQLLSLKFLVGCVGARVLFSLVIQFSPALMLPLLCGICVAISVGFTFVWVTGIRQKKGAFDNTIWWNPLRLVHASIYLLTAWFLYTKKQYLASTVILLDTSIGMLAYLVNHYNNGNLIQLLEKTSLEHINQYFI